MEKDWSTVKCCICGKPLWNGHHTELSDDMKKRYFGNNPWPISENEDDRCCDYCNDSEVITARIKDLFR